MPLAVGLMSGTSLDGVDAVLVDLAETPPRTLATHWQPYSAGIRAAALGLQAPGADELHRANLLANELARCYAQAVDAVLAAGGATPQQVSVVGCHGQTVRHQPAAGYTIQLNNPALLAELTGLPVVADFRSRDIAAGGQGAPLVPAFHAAAFGVPNRHRVILNIGGIANLTDLASGRPVGGFDCGPGNLLMDGWTERHLGKRYDGEGRWAVTGNVLPRLLEQLLAAPFFTQPPPKSCGRDEFNAAWLESRLEGDEMPEDVQATLLELTARTCVAAIERWCEGAQEVYVCGGGAANAALMARLGELLGDRPVVATDVLGQPADWVEAVAFAWLAWRAMNGETGSLPEVTGARGRRVLGAVYPR